MRGSERFFCPPRVFLRSGRIREKHLCDFWKRKIDFFFPVLFLSEKGRIFPDSEGVGGNIGKKIEDFFFVVPRKFYEFSGDPTSAVENRKRFSTAEERLLRFLRNRRGPAACRRKSQAIFDGRRGPFFENFLPISDESFFPSHKWLGEKNPPGTDL